MTAVLDRLRAEGVEVCLAGPDRLAGRIPAGRRDLVDYMRERKAEIVAALRAEQEPVTCPACGGTGAAGTLRGGCWPCSGSGQCTRAVADALARFAGLGRARASKEDAGR